MILTTELESFESTAVTGFDAASESFFLGVCHSLWCRTKTVFSTTIIYRTENGTKHFEVTLSSQRVTATPSFTVPNLLCVKYFFMLFSHVAVARLIDTVYCLCQVNCCSFTLWSQKKYLNLSI